MQGTRPHTLASQVVVALKNVAANPGGIRDVGSVPESGRSLGAGHGNSLQYSCLENLMDGGAQRATVHGVTKSQTQLKRLSTHTDHTGHLVSRIHGPPPLSQSGPDLGVECGAGLWV